MSDVYYKLYKSTRHGMTVVCMQDFDECDYYQDQFVVDIMGRPYQFDNEQDAITCWMDSTETKLDLQHIRQDKLNELL